MGLAAAPLLPSLSQAAIGHAHQRQIGQVAAQIGRQFAGVGIAGVRIACQAFVYHVFQATADVGIAHPQRAARRGLVSRRQMTDQRLEQQCPE